jgi:hypothetical protein
MNLDFEFDHEQAKLYVLFILGCLLGYLCVLAAIELELYYYQSRFVVAKLYTMIQDVEKASQFREASQVQREGVTSPASEGQA